MAKRKVKLTDGAYKDAISGLGTMKEDKNEHICVTDYHAQDLEELASMKMQDGLAEAIVDKPIEAAFANDISIIGDDDGSALKLFDSIGLKAAMKEAGSYQRLTGGAVIVTEYEDDYSIDKEARTDSKVVGYNVYSAGRIEFKNDDFENGKPKLFRILVLGGGEVVVHPSRCTVVKGKKLPDTIADSSNIREAFFGVSRLAPCVETLKQIGAVVGSIVNMAQETGTLLVQLNNLAMILAKPTGQARDELLELLSVMKMGMSSFHATFAGAGDQFKILNHNFAGLPDIWQKLLNTLCAKSGFPSSILIGQSATGLAQTNDGDMKIWNSLVEAERSNYLYKPTCALLADLTRRNLKKELSEFVWGDIQSMSVKEELEAKKLQVDTLGIAQDKGWIEPEPVRKSLFVNGHSWNVSVKE